MASYMELNVVKKYWFKITDHKSKAIIRKFFLFCLKRDYYPYWHPTQWIDVAILTSDISRCDYYTSESENVKSRFYCRPPDGYQNKIVPNNKKDCEVKNIFFRFRDVLKRFEFCFVWNRYTTILMVNGLKVHQMVTKLQCAKKPNIPVIII